MMLRLEGVFCKHDDNYETMIGDVKTHYAFSLRASTANTDMASAPSYVALGEANERLSRPDASLLTGFMWVS